MTVKVSELFQCKGCFTFATHVNAEGNLTGWCDFKRLKASCGTCKLRYVKQAPEACLETARVDYRSVSQGMLVDGAFTSAELGL